MSSHTPVFVSITLVLIILINENKDNAQGWCTLSMLLFSSSCSNLPVCVKRRLEKLGHSDQSKVKMLSQVGPWKGYKRLGTHFKSNHLLHLERSGNLLSLLKSVY